MVPEQLDIHMQKNESAPFIKINSKWVPDLNVKCKSIKLLEDSKGENLVGFEHGYDFLNTIPETQSVRCFALLPQPRLLAPRHGQEGIAPTPGLWQPERLRKRNVILWAHELRLTAPRQSLPNI